MSAMEIQSPKKATRTKVQDTALSARARIQKRQQDKNKENVVESSSGYSTERDIAQLPSTDVQMEGHPEAVMNGRSDVQRMPDIQVSTMSPNELNYVQTSRYPLGATVLVKMRYKETLVLQGEYSVQVRSGSIQVGGAIARSTESLRIFAPTTHSFPVIECLKRSKKRKLGDTSMEDGFDAVFVVESVNSGLRGIGRICPMFRNIWQSDSESLDSFVPIFTSTSPVPLLYTDASWQKTFTQLNLAHDESLASSSAPLMILITGSKSTGKSTFSRHLVNQLNTHSHEGRRPVAYLDLDPGQPTFGPPCGLGLYSIDQPVLGPPFTSMNGCAKALREHHIGYTTPREDPQYYINCALDLLEHYQAHIATSGVPLVINTPGWTKGMGRELLQEIISLAGISDIVVLEPTNEASGLLEDILSGDTPAIRQHIIQTAPGQSNGQRFTPADLRILQKICYFHQLTPSAGNPRYDFTNHMTEQSPWLAPYGQSDSAIAGVIVLDADIPASLIPTVLPASIVSLELISLADTEHPVSAYLSPSDIPRINCIPSSTSTALLPPSKTQTAGLALIRGIDTTTNEIQLLTPIPTAEMERWHREGLAVIAVRGRAELPLWLLWDHMKDKDAEESPYLTFDGAGSGKGGREWRVRKNLMRRSQQAAQRRP